MTDKLNTLVTTSPTGAVAAGASFCGTQVVDVETAAVLHQQHVLGVTATRGAVGRLATHSAGNDAVWKSENVRSVSVEP